MKFFKKIFFAVEFYLVLLLALCLAFVHYGQIKIENVTLSKRNVEKQVSLPFSENMEPNERFEVSFRVKNKLSVPYDLKIIPDDCAEFVTINGNFLPLRDVPGSCDFANGFTLKDSMISPYLVGDNVHYSFQIKNGAGPAGIDVFASPTSFVYLAVIAFSILLLSLICFRISRRSGLSFSISLVIFLGVLVRGYLFVNTHYTQYSNDVGGHVQYVQYIAEKHKIPSTDDCWTCYHPPVYYATATLPYLLSESFGIQSTTMLQLFSLLLSVLTLIFGIHFFKTFLSKKTLLFATLLFSLWPLLFLVAPRIGNDQMFYLLHTLCLFGGVKYLLEGKGKFLLLATVSTILALWTKSTGVVTLGTLLLFMVFGYFGNCRSLNPKRSEITAFVLFLLTVGFLAFQKLFGDASLVGNASGLNSGLIVQNEAPNYLFFDIKTYFLEPFTHPWNDSMGRQYFWNYTLKSSLFGEFILSSTVLGKTLATFMSVSLLGLFVYAFRGFWKTKLKAIHWILLLQGVAFILALAFLRIKHPYACSNDFRYILPALFTFVSFASLGVNLEKASVKWKVLGWILLSVFVLSSVVFFLSCIF